MASSPYSLEQRFEFITDCYKRQAKLFLSHADVMNIILHMAHSMAESGR